MKAVFNDLQDYSSPLDGAVVQNQKELFAVLENARDREPFACELVGENGYMLTLGIGKEVGSVQYSPSNYDPPYLLALAPGYHAGEGEGEEECVEFLCGNTPTPFYKRHILPFETVKQIAAYFVETGERSPEVSWEEV
jgi:immunity protein Imm1 of predicted polymorphic toxin system